MTNFDPTTNRIPFELLTPEEQAILKAWPHGWQIRDLHGNWVDRPDPAWSLHMVYRGKPAPAKVAYQELNRVYTPAEVQHLLGNLPTWEEWKELLAAGYAQKARADRLEAALRFYADFYENPNDGPWGVDSHDYGKIARAALKGEQQ